MFFVTGAVGFVAAGFFENLFTPANMATMINLKVCFMCIDLLINVCDLYY